MRTALFSSSAASNHQNNRNGTGTDTDTVAANETTTTASASASADHPIRTEKPARTKGWSKNREALAERRFPRTWVPLASVFELDPNRPTPLGFLDQKYVCYRQDAAPGGEENGTTKQNWVVMDDVCPHRLAPLSEGRIVRCENSGDATTSTTNATATATTTTTIQCSYHGWEFDREGSCTKIPQALPEIEEAALKSPQSKVTSYSTRIHKNTLWFWPWADTDPLSLMAIYPRGHPEGIMSAIATVDSDDDDDDDDDEEAIESFPATYTRDLPYGWDTLLENLIDPAHIPFAHHGLQGKREDAVPITMTIPESLGGLQPPHDDDDDDKEEEEGGGGGGGDNDGGGENSDDETRQSAAFGTKGLGEAGFFFEWQDRTMGKYRVGTGEFQAPYGIAYEGWFYPDKEAADASQGSHKARKRSVLEEMVREATTRISTGDTENNKTANLRPFKLGVLCIPTKPGWSRAIIFSGPAGRDKQKSKSKSKSKSRSDTKLRPKKKKKKTSIFSIVFSLIPPWVVHLLSNRFLDSDLAFLHFQEQERLRYYDGSNANGHSKNHYYIPGESDRCIAFLRRWIPKFTDYFDDARYDLPAPISDQSKLFDRYSQHTSHCKHCQEGLRYLTKTIRRRAWAGLVASVLVSHFLTGRRKMGLLTKVYGLVCFGVLRLIRSIEPAFRVGGFKHYENH